MSVQLEVIAGDYLGKVFAFDVHDTFLFGRGADCHYLLPEDDRTASRHHFVLEVNPPRVAIVDLGARNGTLVNGTRINTPDPKSAVALEDGDEIAVGKTRLRLKVSSPLRALSTMDASVAAVPVADVAAAAGELPAAAMARYDVIAELGEGGMGAVYRARDKVSGEVVALKIMRPEIALNADARARFLREIEVMKTLSHPAIVGYRDAGADVDGLFLALELCRGGDALAALQRAGGRFGVAQLRPWIPPLIGALSYAKARNVIHRDIKPENIFLDAAGAPRLADFGLAKSLDEVASLSLTGQAAGTPEFMPKEQLLNFKRVGVEVDVFALAATFFFMLTGQFPRPPSPQAQNRFVAVLRTPARPLLSAAPDVDPGIAAVIDRALLDDPAARISDPDEFARAFASL